MQFHFAERTPILIKDRGTPLRLLNTFGLKAVKSSRTLSTCGALVLGMAAPLSGCSNSEPSAGIEESPNDRTAVVPLTSAGAPTLDSIGDISRNFWETKTIMLTGVTGVPRSNGETASLTVSVTPVAGDSSLLAAIPLPSAQSSADLEAGIFSLVFPPMTSNAFTSGSATFQVNVSDGMATISQIFTMTIQGATPSVEAYLVTDTVSPSGKVQLVATQKSSDCEFATPKLLDASSAESTASFSLITLPSDLSIARSVWTANLSGNGLLEGAYSVKALVTCGADGAKAVGETSLALGVSNTALSVELDYPVVKIGGATRFRAQSPAIYSVSGSESVGLLSPNALSMMNPGSDGLWMIPPNSSEGIYSLYTTHGALVARLAVDGTTTPLNFSVSVPHSSDQPNSWNVARSGSRQFHLSPGDESVVTEGAFISEGGGGQFFGLLSSSYAIYEQNPSRSDGTTDYYFVATSRGETKYHQFVTASCTSAGPSACTDPASCLAAGYLWNSGTCSSSDTPTPSCNSSSLSACSNANDCSNASGFWDGSSCSLTQSTGYCVWSNNNNSNYYWNGQTCNFCDAATGYTFNGSVCSCTSGACMHSPPPSAATQLTWMAGNEVYSSTAVQLTVQWAVSPEATSQEIHYFNEANCSGQPAYTFSLLANVNQDGQFYQNPHYSSSFRIRSLNGALHTDSECSPTHTVHPPQE